mgnify:CR=1 FL=1
MSDRLFFPLAGAVVVILTALALVLFAERGRLFRAHHQPPAPQG